MEVVEIHAPGAATRATLERTHVHCGEIRLAGLHAMTLVARMDLFRKQRGRATRGAVSRNSAGLVGGRQMTDGRWVESGEETVRKGEWTVAGGAGPVSAQFQNRRESAVASKRRL